jgi:hypothetical protein
MSITCAHLKHTYHVADRQKEARGARVRQLGTALVQRAQVVGATFAPVSFGDELLPRLLSEYRGKEQEALGCAEGLILLEMVGGRDT